MYGLKDPTFEQRSPQQFIVTFHRSDKYDPEVWYRRKVESEAVEAAARHIMTDMLTEDEAMAYNAILSGKGDTVDDISRSTGLSQSKIKRIALKLKETNATESMSSSLRTTFDQIELMVN